MKNLLLTTVTATMVLAIPPAFASIADEAEQGLSVYPSAGECHFAKGAATTQRGRVTHQLIYVCN